MREDWTLIRRIKGGHSYWKRTVGSVGIADDSGSYPENCEPNDDPPLLLDRSRPVYIGAEGNSVPLKHENNRTSTTPVNGFEALWVASQFRMVIHTRETKDASPMRFMVDPEHLDGARSRAMIDLVAGLK